MSDACEPLDLKAYSPKKRVWIKSRGITAVYVVAPAEQRPVKIGYAWDLPARHVVIQTGNWNPLSVFGVVWTPGYPVAARLESVAHDRLKDRKIFGEWFDAPAGEVVELLDALCKELYPTVWFLSHHDMIEKLRKKQLDKRDALAPA